MYDFVDRRVTDLDRGGRFLLWAMRRWVHEMTFRRCPMTAMGPTFIQHRLRAALQPFDEAMTILNRHGAMNFRFAPVNCQRVTEDEAVLLQLVRSMRADSTADVRATIALIVREEQVQPMLSALTRLSMRLAVTGLVPERPAAPCTGGGNR